MEKQIFKKGDRVFDIRFGWGTVIDDNRCLLYPIGVKFDKDNSKEIIVYTNNGISDSSKKFSLLSFTEYKLQGFTLRRPLNYDDYIGKWGKFFNENETNIAIDILTDYYGSSVKAPFESRFTTYDSFEPLTEEQLKVLGLCN